MSAQNQEPYGKLRLFNTNSEFLGQVSPKIKKNKIIGGWFFLMSVRAGWCRAQWIQAGHGAPWGNKCSSWYCPLPPEVSESLLAMSWERIPANSPCHCLCKMRIPSWLLLGRILGSSTSNLILMELLAAFFLLFLIVVLENGGGFKQPFSSWILCGVYTALKQKSLKRKFQCLVSADFKEFFSLFLAVKGVGINWSRGLRGELGFVELWGYTRLGIVFLINMHQYLLWIQHGGELCVFGPQTLILEQKRRYILRFAVQRQKVIFF